MKKDRFTKEERCIHCVGLHAQMYGAPADEEFINGVMKDYHGMSPEEVTTLLSELKETKKLDWWEGKYTEGWIIYGT